MNCLECSRRFECMAIRELETWELLETNCHEFNNEIDAQVKEVYKDNQELYAINKGLEDGISYQKKTMEVYYVKLQELRAIIDFQKKLLQRHYNKEAEAKEFATLLDNIPNSAMENY